MGFDTITSDEIDQLPPFTAVAVADVIRSPPPRRIELWLPNPTSGRLELSAAVRSEGDGDPTQTVRASEELRAFFQPLQARAAQPKPPLPPEKPAQRLEAPRTIPVVKEPTPTLPKTNQRRRFSAELALGLPLEAASVGIDAVIRGRWQLRRSLGVGLVTALPVLGSVVRSTNGDGNSAVISATLAGGEVSLGMDTLRMGVLARVGAAVAWIRATGNATATYSDKPDSSVATLPFVGAEGWFCLTDHLSLCVGGDVGAAIPQSRILFAGHQEAQWGQPFGLLSTGLRVTF